MANIRCYTYDDATGLLALVGIVDDFKSFNFGRTYSDLGEWTLVLDGNSINASRIKGMQIISVSNGVAGLVYKCDEAKTDNDYTITYTGVELKGLASQRQIYPPEGQAYQAYTNVAPEYVIAQLIQQQIINASDTDRRITGTIAAYTQSADRIDFSGRFDNVGEAIQKIASTYYIGWYADIQDGAIVWHIYRGTDRRKSQSTNSRMIVSYALDSFGNSTLTNVSQLPNVALVAGQGEGVDRAISIVGSGTGLSRSEIFIDARDLADEAALPARGTQALAEYGDNQTYETTFSNSFINQYKNPYNLGDIGTIEDSRLATGELDFMLTAVTEVYENGQFRLDATFGYDKQTLKDAIQRSQGSTQGLINSEITQTAITNAIAQAVAQAVPQAVAQAKLAIYPVGSIYMSVSSTSPATLFGGTWAAWGTGRVPVGINASEAEFNTVEKTGGHKNLQSHSHSVPAHTHDVGNQSASHSHTVNSTGTCTTSATSKTLTGQFWNMAVQSASTPMSANGVFTAAIRDTSGAPSPSSVVFTVGNYDAVNFDATHEHTVPNHTHTMGNQSASHNHSVTGGACTAGSTGAGNAENLQPYITCYMWKRTA